MYQPRTYRSHTKSEDLVSFRVAVAETDLFISAEKDLSQQANDYVRSLRGSLESYITCHPEFEKALRPIDVDKTAPLIVREMAEAARLADVGPMAAVAGAIAEAVGNQLLNYSSQIIVENGGDIFISSKRPRVVGIYAGGSKFSGRLALEIEPEKSPCGVCTSSGTVGHSLSFGRADAVCIISRSTSLADAAATSVCNIVHTKDEIDQAIEKGRVIKGISGILIVIGDRFGAWGDIKIIGDRFLLSEP